MSLRHTDGPMWKSPPAEKKKRKGLAKMSLKRKAVQAARSAFVDEQLKKRPFCEAGPIIGKHTGFQRFSNNHPRDNVWFHCRSRSSAMHEPLTRARAPGPDTILEEKNSLAVCDACHGWIHDHPKDAESLGLLKSSRGL